MALFSCESGQENLGVGGNDTTIEIPEYGYIYFDGAAASRGVLYETTADDKRLKANFGVIGYTHTYDDWEDAKVQSKPNVFYNQEVVWDGSVHSYYKKGNETTNGLEQWIGKQKYAFFAYYPYVESDNMSSSNIKLSGDGYEGDPYIDFTFSRNDLAAQVDVMTGWDIDVDYSTPTVAFNMEHRLAAIDVVANNLYINVEDQSARADEIEITSITIKLDSLVYDNVRIPLNTRDIAGLDYTKYGEATNKTATYELGTNMYNKTIKDVVNTQVTGSAYTSSMIVIPQSQVLRGNINVGYITKRDGTTIGTVNAKDYPFSFNREIVAGYRYYIQINFAPGNVTIAVLESDMWEEENINHDFE